MPDFITDTKLNYSGINSWYPWFPISNSKYNIQGEFEYDKIEDRNLRRLAGLCNINKTDSYKFPCEMSDFYDESSDIFKTKNTEEVESSLEDDINVAVNKKGLLIFLYKFIKIMPTIFIKKTLKKLSSYVD